MLSSAIYNLILLCAGHALCDYPLQSDFLARGKRLSGVVIENQDATEIIQRHDGPDTLHYVDPPYVHATRNMARGNAAYEWEMSDEDHENLASTLHGVEGMVVLSGYQCDLYDSLYGDWQRIERPSTADGRRPRIESLWFNGKAWGSQSQMKLAEVVSSC